MAARKYFISGRVQGVFFRASTRAEAERLGLSGHALNLTDGRVEVLAIGPGEQLESLAGWLEQGPPGARVDAIDEVPADEAECSVAGRFVCG